MIDYEYADLFYGSHAKTWIFTCIDPDVQLTFSNDDIVQESISLERGMCETDFFAYGTYSSNSIRVGVFKTEEQFKGKRFLVDVVLDNHTEAPLTVGTFTCYSDNLSSDRKSRELVMYDDLYKLSELDVAAWYNHFFDTDEPVYMVQFRTSFFEDCLHIDCELADSQGTALSADFMQIKKAANYRTLMASTVLKSILVANCVNGAMTNINKFRWVRIKEYDMHMAPPDPHWDIIPDIVLDNSKFYTCNYEEYQVLYADGVRVIIDPDNIIIPVIPTHDLPAVDNALDISYDNMFFRDIETSEITSMLAANYDKIHHRISFTPARIQLRGNICYEPGDVVQVDIDGKTIYTVIIKQTITGVQGLTMTLSCQGDERFSNPLSVESASYDDYAGAEGQGGDADHAQTAWKLRSASVSDEEEIRYYTYLTKNKNFIVSNERDEGHSRANDVTDECSIGSKQFPWGAGYFKKLFVGDGDDAISYENDLVELLRNIGIRLLDEPNDVVAEAKFEQGLLRVEIKWSDPSNINNNKPVPCSWEGTVLVKNESHVPRHRWDGTVLVDSTTRNAYSETAYIDSDVELNKVYYYGIFPYYTANTDDPNNPIKYYRYTKTATVSTKQEDLATFDYSGEIQVYVVPETGIYRLEAWGAQGSNDDNVRGGYGAYSVGEVQLQRGELLYIGVGGQNGYNGGGSQHSVRLVPWNTGTDSEITDMLMAFYSGQISLSDVKSVWSVGQYRTIHIDAIPGSDTYEAQPAQDINFYILDFEHDDLTTPINGHTKALISVGMDSVLSAYGGLNPNQTTIGSWKESVRRAWCNGVCLNALPNTLRSHVKAVNKITSIGGGTTSSETEITSDYIWIMSQYELYGGTTLAAANEGTPYTHRAIYKGYHYFQRSPVRGALTGYCFMGNNGVPCQNNDGGRALGLVLNFCL